MEGNIITRRQILKGVGLFAGGPCSDRDLPWPARSRLFTEEDTGLVHCQAGALNVASQRIFD